MPTGSDQGAAAVPYSRISLKPFLILALVVAGVLAGSGEAAAHARSESYSEWHIASSTLTGTVTVPAGELAALISAGNTSSLDELLVRALRDHVRVTSGNGDCDIASTASLRAARGFARAEIRFDCLDHEPETVVYRVLLDAVPAHVNYARMYAQDRFVAEVLLTDRHDTWSRGSEIEPLTHSFSSFLGLGLRHIAGGLDHIAFLLGMLLVAGGIGRGVVAVTGFTVGHSVSLAAAVLGFLSADSRLVEAFIGFTVALVSVEYFLMRRPEQRSAAIVATLVAWITGLLALLWGLVTVKASLAYLGFGTFAFCYLVAAARVPVAGSRLGDAVLFAATACFGLVHGFGFAGFLMDTGIRGSSLFVPLLGFNVGVEAGQLLLVAIFFLITYALRAQRLRLTAPLIAACLCGIGVYWFIDRSLTG